MYAHICICTYIQPCLSVCLQLYISSSICVHTHTHMCVYIWCVSVCGYIGASISVYRFTQGSYFVYTYIGVCFWVHQCLLVGVYPCQ